MWSMMWEIRFTWHCLVEVADVHVAGEDAKADDEQRDEAGGRRGVDAVAGGTRGVGGRRRWRWQCLFVAEVVAEAIAAPRQVARLVRVVPSRRRLFAPHPATTIIGRPRQRPNLRPRSRHRARLVRRQRRPTLAATTPTPTPRPCPIVILLPGPGNNARHFT